MSKGTEFTTELKFRLEALSNNPKVQLKYCHYRSIRNFVNHFNEIKTDEKEKIYLLLMEYFNLIETENEIDRIKSLDNFNHYIRPIGEYFEEYYDFVPMISWWVILFWLVLLGLINFILNIPVWIFITISTLILVYYSRVVIKIIKNKTYGFMW